MNTELLGVILSGQLLLVVWQIYKEISDRKEKKREKARQAERDDAALRNMVFKLYRDSMEQKIVAAFERADSDSEDLKEYLMMLKDDMTFYINQGGNGLIKEMYTHLQDHIRQSKGESYYILLVLD